MDFELTQDQKMIAESAAAFARRESPVTRLRALLSGDLTPPRHVVLQFDTLVLASGETVPGLRLFSAS